MRNTMFFMSAIVATKLKLSRPMSGIPLLPFIFSHHSVSVNSSHEYELKSTPSTPTIQKLGDKVMYSRYRTIIQRDVIIPTGKTVSFDIVHQEHPSIVVFSWNISSSTCTLIREYHPGPQVFILVRQINLFYVFYQ